jgi:hypothetical protein
MFIIGQKLPVIRIIFAQCVGSLLFVEAAFMPADGIHVDSALTLTECINHWFQL